MTWTTVKIGDVAQVKGGKRLPKGMSVQDMVTEYPYVRVTDFDPDGVNLNNVKFISKEAHKATSRYIINCTDVYISIAGTIGLVGIVPKQLDGANLTENAAKICEISEDINPQFLMYFLRSRIGQGLINAQVVGTSQPKLALFRIKDIEIPAPEKTVQDEIASVLSKYDNLIENNNRRIAILEDMAQSLYREWFVNFRYPNHEDNLDADGNPKLIDSPLGQIPEGWEVKRLDDYVTLQRGFDLPKAKRNNEGGVPIYAASGLTGYHDEIKAKGPGIVTGRSGTLGIVKLVLEDHWPLNTSLWVKKFENCTAHYAYYLLDSIGLERFNSGASVPTLNRNDVHGNPVIAPPLELVNKFEEIVAVKHKQINVLKRKNTNLKQQRDMLLPKLISGQIELKD